MSGQWLSLGTSSTGIHRKMKTESDGSITIVKEQDMKAMIEEIKTVREMQPNRGYTPSKDLQSVALIPSLFLHKWIQEEGGDPSVIWADDERYDSMLTKKLNDPDYACFRTGTGRIGLTQNLRMI